MRLSETAQGKRVKVVEFLNDKNTIVKFENVGLKTGTVVTVCNIAPLSTPIEIRFGNIRLAIARAEAAKIAVKEIKDV
ncbi:MAG: ferrous iron transport protein A [Clostridia bacterium]|nr:ferrous iron transport protein A [Clostridia bacterium]